MPKIDEIEEKIQTLQKMKDILTTLETHCTSDSSINTCPILGALDQGPAHENSELLTNFCRVNPSNWAGFSAKACLLGLLARLHSVPQFVYVFVPLSL